MRRVVLAIVSTAASLVLLLSFKTHGASVVAPPVASSSATGSTSAAGTGVSASGTKTVTGNAIDTQYGPVQVKITVTNGKITAANAVEYPLNNPRDQQINAYAIPALNAEAVQSGSANIDMISGATYTSDGYVQSLQSALNKANA